VNRIRRFLQEAWSELKKVTWPTAAQTRNLTVLVFAVSLAVGMYVFVWDRLFQTVVGILSQNL
jgi:preprotein translocase SecE subunit